VHSGRAIRAAAVSFVVLLLLWSAAPPALAVSVGVVEGSILDAQSHPVEEADVTLQGMRGGLQKTRSDALGTFRFPAAAVGENYILTIEADGYRGVSYEGFRLDANQTRRFSVRLKRPGERDVAVFLSRDPYPFDDLLRSLLQGLEAPARVFDLDREENPEEVVRRVRSERPNLVLGSGLMAARLVRREIPDIPAILSLLGDPRLHDLEQVNVSFLAMNPPPADLVARLHAIVPEAKRVGLLFDARESPLVARDLVHEARRAGLNVLSRPCYGVHRLGEALAGLHGRVDALIVPFDPLSNESAALDDITHWALSERVALFAPGPDWVRRGALLSYGPTPETLGRELSRLASQVLFEGRQPAELRWGPRTAPFLALNATTALALGLEVPDGVTVDATY
jgi:putative ABC transport system substrate-binding protein